MSEIELRDDEPGFTIDRGPDGQVTVSIDADGASVTVTVGRSQEAASLLAESLRHLAEDAEAIVEDWEALPDEHDAYITFDRGRYHVTLEGCRVGDYPSQEVAEIELASAMAEAGVFPAAWLVTDHGNCVAVDAAVRRWHEEGGTAMAALLGVQYQPGDRVRHEGIGLTCVVVGDWGPAGVEVYTAGDPTIRDHVTDRRLLTPVH